jgi:hypothetical protein
MPDVKYGHYTSTAGLLGIVRDERLWATNIKFLNDEHEFLHAVGLIKEIIANQKSAFGPVFEEYKKFLTSKLDNLDDFRADSVFTLSFSAETDLLSQWRGYCPNNNGYCIVFDGQKLFEAVRDKFEESHLVQCVYDESTKQTKIKKILNEHWHKFAKLESPKEKRHLVEELSKTFVLFASYFKHPSFAEEQEHRLVILLEYASDHDLKFREGRSSLVPYIELPASRKLIKMICIGPNANKALALRALEPFLEKTSGIPSFISTVELVHSKTPYRPW